MVLLLDIVFDVLSPYIEVFAEPFDIGTVFVFVGFIICGDTMNHDDRCL